MRKFALLVVTLVVTITSNSGIIYMPENASDAAKTGIIAAPAKTTVASKQKVSKGKLFMKIFKSKLEKIGKAGKKAGDKSKVVAILLALFLGNLGIHDFYLGNKKAGFIKIGLTVIGLALIIAGFAAFVATETVAFPVLALIGYIVLLGVSIWALIDLIKIITGKYEPVDGSYTD